MYFRMWWTDHSKSRSLNMEERFPERRVWATTLEGVFTAAHMLSQKTGGHVSIETDHDNISKRLRLCSVWPDGRVLSK